MFRPIRSLVLACALFPSAAAAQMTNIVFGASIDRNYIADAIYSPGSVVCRPELVRCVEGTSWVQIVSAMRGDSYVNFAVESYMAADQVPLIYKVTPAAGMRFFIGNFDLNDYCWNGTDVDKRANTGAAITAGVYWLGAGTRVTGRALAPGWPAAPVNAIGAYSTTSGAVTPSFTFTGSYLAIGTQIQDGNLGTFKVTIDGTDYGPFSNNGQNGKGVDTKLRLQCVFGANPVPCWSPAGVVISGLATGSHTATITVTSASGPAVYIDYVAWGSNDLPIVVLAPTRHAPGGYAHNCTHPSPAPSDADQALYSAQKQSIASQATANGLNVSFVDAQAVLDPNKPSNWQRDLEHPSGDGNAIYAVTGINPAIP